MHEQPATSRSVSLLARSVRTAAARVRPLLSQDSDDPDYVALMFCDPLSCSSDAEVVRMELPAVRDGE